MTHCSLLQSIVYQEMFINYWWFSLFRKICAPLHIPLLLLSANHFSIPFQVYQLHVQCSLLTACTLKKISVLSKTLKTPFCDREKLTFCALYALTMHICRNNDYHQMVLDAPSQCALRMLVHVQGLLTIGKNRASRQDGHWTTSLLVCIRE